VRSLRPLLVAMLAPLLLGQAEPRLVPDVSHRDIEIRYSFSGAELLLFGAILYPGGRTPDRDVDIRGRRNVSSFARSRRSPESG
jgi:hypothetical protein